MSSVGEPRGATQLRYQREIAMRPERGHAATDKPKAPPTPTVRFMCCMQPVTACYGPQGVLTDAEGFMVCPAHKQRRYGWKTARAIPGTQAARYHGESDLERDLVIQAELFPHLFNEEETEPESAVNRTFVLTDAEMELLGK